MYSSTVLQKRPARTVRPQRITFQDGLVGCESWRRFELRVEPEHPELAVLQCLDDADAAFILSEPRNFCPDYRVTLSQADREALKLREEENPVVLCTLTVNQAEGVITANLLGPLAINQRAGLGRQLVLSGTDYSTRHRVGAFREEVDDARSYAQSG